MPWILETTLNNALIATAMGLIVVAVSRFLRHRPAVIHAMWLIVLLKLVTPPLVHVPINVGSGTRYASSSALLGSAAEPANSSPMGTGASEGRSGANAGHSDSDVVTMESELQRQTAARELQTRISSATWALAIGCWLIGTGVWVTVAAVRIIRFSRLLRAARPCSHDVATIADRIAGRLGLTKTPVIEVVDAHISPLVWHGRRRPRIVLPAELVSKWTDERIELVLVHEIAHVKRGDHWIRWFTLLVLAAYWWHPIAWLAVRRLRVAEEQCCDAMVIAALPGRAHAYAETLLATLDLLVARRSPPVLASGIDSGGSLKRRCEMILSDRTTFRMGGATGLLLLLSAICILPLATMVRADDESKKENAAAQPQDAEKDQPKGDERSIIASWHKDPAWKAKDCTVCHQGLKSPIGYKKQFEAFKEQADKIRKLNRREELEGATLGLRNLGFDDKLIKELLKDRKKLKDVNHVIQNILSLTGEEEAKPKQGKAGAVDLGPGRPFIDLKTEKSDRQSDSDTIKDHKLRQENESKSLIERGQGK